MESLYANLEGENSLQQIAYIGLGSNQGDKILNITRANKLIEEIEGLQIVKHSALYITSPWGKTDQEDFLNQVIKIETELSPLDLLHRLQEIEIKLGRLRNEKWGPRVIDLDILLYGEAKIQNMELTVPHPYLLERLFVLIPLQEIEPDLIFPDGSKIEEVLDRIPRREGANNSIEKLQ